MAPGSNRSVFCAAVFLLVATLLVHAMHSPEPALSQTPTAESGPPSTAPRPIVGYGTSGLPQPVIEMRDAILAAVRSGDIEELRIAIEFNEIKPIIGDKAAGDPIAQLKALSADGGGRDVLTAIGILFLEAGWVTLPVGRDLENNKVYVWPHFVETGVNDLSPQHEAELSRLALAEDVAIMRKSGRYCGWRIGLGADGVWHFLTK